MICHGLIAWISRLPVSWIRTGPLAASLCLCSGREALLCGPLEHEQMCVRTGEQNKILEFINMHQENSLSQQLMKTLSTQRADRN